MIALWMVAGAWATDCADLSDPDGPTDAPRQGLPTGPVSASLQDGGLGSARRACPRTEVAVAPRGLLLVDTPSFYGHIVAGLGLDGSVALDERTELFGRLELVRYDTVISVVTASYLGPGHTTLGASRLLSDEAVAWTLTGKAVLPTAFGLYEHAWPFGLDVGLAGHWAEGPWEVHGQLTALGSAAASRGAALPRAGIAPVIGGAWHPSRTLAVLLDVQSMFLYTAPLDALAVAPALRLGTGRHWGGELGATLPLAGRERALAAVELRWAWRALPPTAL